MRKYFLLTKCNTNIDTNFFHVKILALKCYDIANYNKFTLKLLSVNYTARITLVKIYRHLTLLVIDNVYNNFSYGIVPVCGTRQHLQYFSSQHSQLSGMC